jgi:benzodiazapine receptor
MTELEPCASRGRPAIELLVAVCVCLLAGGIGAVSVSNSAGGWYQTIHRPGFTPPDWIFGPVWTALYVLMGMSAWLLWRARVRPVSPAARAAATWALVVFAIQLLLNATWSIIFFGLHAIGWAFFELAVLWVAIVGTILLSWRASRLAAVLLFPYLAWTTFAGVLNAAIWRLNA